MIGEAILFCCLSRRKTGGGTEASINAAGCNFNSFIRRAIRFVGMLTFLVFGLRPMNAWFFLIHVAFSHIIIPDMIFGPLVQLSHIKPFILRCSCVWPLCDRPYYRHSAANDWLSNTLLPHCVQTQLHHTECQL